MRSSAHPTPAPAARQVPPGTGESVPRRRCLRGQVANKIRGIKHQRYG